jgi:hypothetical protein
MVELHSRMKQEHGNSPNESNHPLPHGRNLSKGKLPYLLIWNDFIPSQAQHVTQFLAQTDTVIACPTLKEQLSLRPTISFFRGHFSYVTAPPSATKTTELRDPAQHTIEARRR